jgi:hypothetical protein
MSSHLPIINSWTGSSFRESPKQSVSSLLTSPNHTQQPNSTLQNSETQQPKPLSARRTS